MDKKASQLSEYSDVIVNSTFQTLLKVETILTRLRGETPVDMPKTVSPTKDADARIPSIMDQFDVAASNLQMIEAKLHQLQDIVGVPGTNQTGNVSEKRRA